MNRSKIEWCDHTWNPITGCLHGCSYCYARKSTARFAGDVRMNKMCVSDYRTEEEPYGQQTLYILDKPMVNEGGNIIVYPFGFEPTFHRYRLDTIDKLKTGCRIFVGAMADIFGEWVPDEWITEIFEECRKKPEHNFLFLTKNPDRYGEIYLPAGNNMWYGTTITNLIDAKRKEKLPPLRKTFLSIEPLHDDVAQCGDYLVRDIDWMIIGAETGLSASKVVPKREWILKLVDLADRWKVPVFMKDSLESIVGSDNMRREYPPELLRKEISEKRKAKLYDICCVCGKLMRKSEMVSLYAKSDQMGMPRVYAWMCERDFKEHCNKLRVQNPTDTGGEDTNGE